MSGESRRGKPIRGKATFPLDFDTELAYTISRHPTIRSMGGEASAQSTDSSRAGDQRCGSTVRFSSLRLTRSLATRSGARIRPGRRRGDGPKPSDRPGGRGRAARAGRGALSPRAARVGLGIPSGESADQLTSRPLLRPEAGCAFARRSPERGCREPRQTTHDEMDAGAIAFGGRRVDRVVTRIRITGTRWIRTGDVRPFMTRAEPTFAPHSGP